LSVCCCCLSGDELKRKRKDNGKIKLYEVTVKFEVSKISEKGDFRTQNQDRVDYAFNKYGQFLAIVCDGMGGHPHGDLAAEIGLNEFLALFKTTNFANFKRYEIRQ